MADPGTVTDRDGVDAAMERVLQAEQQARLAVEAAREEARRIGEQARGEARAVEERARLRLARLRRAMAQRLQAELTAVREHASALPAHEQPGEHEWRALEEAVERLAARLTTGEAR